MWKEIIDLEGFDEMANLRSSYGCAANIGGQFYMNNIERKKDCHYYIYKNDKINLAIGYKEIDGYINIITYVINADAKDYREALRLMGEHEKEYVSKRDIKTLIINYGTEDVVQMNNANKGVNILGFIEVIRIAKEEYEKIGFKFYITKKQIKTVL